MKLHWPYKQMSFIFFEGSCDKNQTYIGKTNRHLATRVREYFSGNFEHISCNTCNHSTIDNFHILTHGKNDFDNIVRGLLHQETKTSLK